MDKPRITEPRQLTIVSNAMAEAKETLNSFSSQYISFANNIFEISKRANEFLDVTRSASKALPLMIESAKDAAKEMTFLMDTDSGSGSTSGGRLFSMNPLADFDIRIAGGYIPPASGHTQAIILRKIEELEDLLKPQFGVIKSISITGLDLLSMIPEHGNKYRTPKKIAKLFLTTLEVDSFEILKCIIPTIIGNNRKLKRRKISRKVYESSRDEYDRKIRNSLKYLNKIAYGIGYILKFHDSHIKAVTLKKDN